MTEMKPVNWMFRRFIRRKLMERSKIDAANPQELTTPKTVAAFLVLHQGHWDGSDEMLPHYLWCEALYTDGTARSCNCGVRHLAEGRPIRFLLSRLRSRANQTAEIARILLRTPRLEGQPERETGKEQCSRLRALKREIQEQRRARTVFFPFPRDELRQVRGGRRDV